MLRRNLFYTGVTRGKRLVVLVGQKNAVAIAVRNASGRRRWSKLDESGWPVKRTPLNGLARGPAKTGQQISVGGESRAAAIRGRRLQEPDAEPVRFGVHFGIIEWLRWESRNHGAVGVARQSRTCRDASLTQSGCAIRFVLVHFGIIEWLRWESRNHGAVGVARQSRTCRDASLNWFSSPVNAPYEVNGLQDHVLACRFIFAATQNAQETQSGCAMKTGKVSGSFNPF